MPTGVVVMRGLESLDLYSSSEAWDMLVAAKRAVDELNRDVYAQIVTGYVERAIENKPAATQTSLRKLYQTQWMNCSGFPSDILAQTDALVQSWADFARKFRLYYDDNIGWWDRFWGFNSTSIYNEAKNRLEATNQFRDQFVSAAGVDPSTPPVTPPKPYTQLDLPNWLSMKNFLIVAGVVGAILVAPTVIQWASKKKSVEGLFLCKPGHAGCDGPYADNAWEDLIRLAKKQKVQLWRGERRPDFRIL